MSRTKGILLEAAFTCFFMCSCFPLLRGRDSWIVVRIDMSPTAGTGHTKKKVLPGFEPGLLGRVPDLLQGFHGALYCV